MMNRVQTEGPGGVSNPLEKWHLLSGTVKWLLLLLSALMIVGISRGELAEIRLNAVTLCLSCLGLGR